MGVARRLFEFMLEILAKRPDFAQCPFTGSRGRGIDRPLRAYRSCGPRDACWTLRPRRTPRAT